MNNPARIEVDCYLNAAEKLVVTLRMPGTVTPRTLSRAEAAAMLSDLTAALRVRDGEPETVEAAHATMSPVRGW